MGKDRMLHNMPVSSGCKRLILLCCFVGGLLSSACTTDQLPTTAGGTAEDNQNSEFVIGWQTAWAPAGEIAQVLIHTDIAKRCGVKVQFKPFLFGTEMNEAALNGQVNCLNTGSVPTISLLSRDKDWKIVGRLIRQPLAIIARAGSNLKNIDGLKGKSVGVPFGSGPHPYLLDALKRSHLKSGESADNVRLVNILPSEQIIALSQGSVDAIATWEPQTSLTLAKKLGELIYEKTDMGFIVVSNRLVKQEPKAVEALLKAYIEANYYVATNRREADLWFSQVSRMDPQLLSSLKIVEPNLSAKKIEEISLDVSQKDIADMQRVADVMLENGLVKQAVFLGDFVDSTYLRKAEAAIGRGLQANATADAPAK